MVCDALVAGCWRSGAGQPAMRSEWGMLLDLVDLVVVVVVVVVVMVVLVAAVVVI